MSAVGKRTTVGRAVKGEHRSPVNAPLSRYGGWEQAANERGASPTDLRPNPASLQLLTDA